MITKQMQVDRVFRALGDPTRRAIIERISERPIPASDLVKPLKISLAAVLQQLQLLELSGLIRTEKTGRVRTCRLEPAALTMAGEWLADRRALWERRMDKLEELLAEPDETPGAQS
jgi:DNA-binding transcriptional ArsR family regulator